MKQASSGTEDELPSAEPKIVCPKKDHCGRAATGVALNTLSPITPTTSNDAISRTSVPVNGLPSVQPAAEDASSEITDARGPTANGDDHLLNNCRHRSPLERVARATKLCVDLTSQPNALLEDPNVNIPCHCGQLCEVPTAELGNAELVERLRLGQTQRDFVRLRVFVNTLLGSTLTGPDDNNTSIENIKSALQNVFRLLATVYRSSNNYSKLPLEMRRLLDVALKRIFILAESHPEIPAAILHNADTYVLDYSGRDVLYHLARCDPNFAVHLQSYLIESMVEAGTKIQQESTAAEETDDEDGSVMNLLWTHRHRYQSCAFLLLSSVLDQRSTPTCANNGAFTTNRQTVVNISKTTADSFSLPDQSKLADRRVENVRGKFHSISPGLKQTSVSQRNDEINAIYQLQRLQLNPDLFWSLIVLRDKVTEYFGDCKKSEV